ncbi:putative F-box/LRR-repeat protein At4g15060 [Zea mays]|uniref:putative F-box/LRR-repeat protein At4g15060 n=1 Tax=Zea mays TaxID=4577 RepID=UPI0002217D6B|nr:putative F-box/LRR-repeat protein At4g15060 [Zea mays]|eukprot:XP_008663894.1 putative F-box/LRR-repeat protein At4g15060 [Zea mays]
MEQKDRRSCLPDDVLQSILRKLSLKQAVRTGALSRWWESQWIRALASSPVVDLTDDPDFARGQPPALSAATVDRCLRLHTELGAPLDMFRVALVCPSDLDGQDVIGWIATGLRRGARAVEVDLAPPPPEEEDEEEEGEEEEDPHAGHEAPLLELPADLFQARNSLERLALGSFSLHAVPLPAVGLAGLRSLSLSHVDVTDEALRGLVANCPALERLSLRRCSRLAMVSVASETLRVLELVGCQALKQLCVDAPALESFALHCNIFVTNPDAPCEWDWDTPVEVDLLGPPALRDVYLSHIGCDTRLDTEHNALYPSLCLDVVLARILTICSIGLLVRTENHNAHKLIRSVTIYSCGSDQHVDSLSWLDPFKDMPNLEELQLLMDYEGYCLEAVSGFFKLIPLPVLQRLFVCLHIDHEPEGEGSSSAAVWSVENDDSKDMAPKEEIVLDQLTFIKFVNFSGTWCQLRLLSFFLDKSPVLQQLVLVTPEGEGALGDDRLKVIHERVAALEKASSEASITVCRPKEDDTPNHPHTRYFHEEYETM